MDLKYQREELIFADGGGLESNKKMLWEKKFQQ